MQKDIQPDTLPEPSVQSFEKTSFKSVALNVFNFIKKYWKVEAIVVAVIIVAVVLFNFIPVINVNETKLVNLGSTVRLKSGETAKLKSGNVSVKIVNFTNNPCPQGSQCIWSGVDVEYMLTVDGQKYATGSTNTKNTSGYQVNTVSSDYKTYAEIQITQAKE